MKQGLAFVSSSLILVLAVAACEDGSGDDGWPGHGVGAGAGAGAAPGSGGSGATASGNDAGAAAGSAGSSVVAADPCDRYIDCVAQTTPEGLDAVLSAYGTEGSCWQQEDQALCESACRTGTIAAHHAHPDAEACNTCQTSDDCPSSLPACDVAGERCVACLGDGDCEDWAEPGCNLSTHTCVACTRDDHCPGARCDTATSTCVECLENADCYGQPGGPVCDAATRSCRGCVDDAECAPGLCSNGACVECHTDADCGGDRPRCGPYSVCIECTDDADCTPGLCNMLGVCCGKTICEDSGSTCGYALDANCPFLPIPCGACGSGHVCFDQACAPAPSTGCSNCGSSPCGYDPFSNQVLCVASHPSCTKDDRDCGPGYLCKTYQSQVTGDTVYYCARYCLPGMTCPGSAACEVDVNTGYGTCP